MGDQPGAGGSYSYKIKGHSRQRRAVKPYSRPSDHKKGVLESVKEFFSPSWLLDFWKGEKVVTDDNVDDWDNDREGEEPLQTNQEYGGPSGIPGTSTEVFGNGGLGIVASAQTRNLTSPKSGLSSLLSLKSRTSTRTETLETRTTGFPSSVSETTKSSHDFSSTATETRTEMEPQATEVSMAPISSSKESRPDPTSSLFGSLPGPSSTPDPTSSLFGALPGPSSNPSQETETPGPSLMSARPQPRSVFRSRPEFSVSAFGSPLPPRPSSQAGRRYSSPYYSGKTIFGGAASSNTSKRARVSSPSSLEHAKPVKRQIRPTPISGPNVGGVASQTAKRILETLEKMSSPLVDAKKIPPSPPFSTSSSPLSFAQSRRRKTPKQPNTRPVGSPRKLEGRFSAPPVQSLSVPQQASISRIRTDNPATQKTSTPMTTASVRQFPSTNTAKPFVPTPLPMSLSPMETAKGGGGKIRAAKTSTTHYKAQATVEEEQEEVNPLPVITSAVPLKLPSGAGLPSFAFPTSKPTTKTTSNKQCEPAFSTSKSKPSDVSCNNFKFSVPEPKISTSNVCPSSKSSPHKTIKYSFSSPAPVNTSEPSATESDKGVSLLDKFKPAEGSWECSVCMVNNKRDALSCVACTTPKPSSKQTSLPSNDLFKKLQPPRGSWTCNTCTLTNKETDQKCIACEAPKPSSSEKGKAPSNYKSDNLLKKFAPPSDSWECPTCMVDNKGQDLKCVACQETKPGAKPACNNSLSKLFAPAQGSWTCDTCMIDNKPDTVKCAACETPKPGSSASEGVSKLTNSSFKFGSSESNSKEDTSLKTIAFGVSPTSDSSLTTFSSPFVFGAPSTSSNHTKTVTFGSSETVSSRKPVQFGSTSTSFKFGSSQDNPKVVETFQFGKATDSKPSETQLFKFGSSEASKEKQSTYQFGSPPKTDNPKPAPFLFGASKSPLKNSETVTSQVEKEASSKTTTPSQALPKVGRTSIAQAAAAGLLKIPSSVDVVDLTSDDGPQKDVAPPNVNLFAGQGLPTTSQILATNTGPAKPAVSSTTSTLPSLPFAFGAPVPKPTEDPSKAKPFAFTPVATCSAPLATFGQTSVAVTTPMTGFAFGASVDSTDKAVSSAPVPSFSNVPQQGNTLAAFGEATKTTTSSIASSPFVFKGSTNATGKFGSTLPKANSTSGFAFSGAASSGTSEATKTTKSTTASSPFVFKGSTEATAKFGSTSTAAASTSGFAFGGAASSSGFAFGGGNTGNAAAVSTPPTFPFGANAAETQKSGFAFGSSTQQPFAFGSTPANRTPAIGAVTQTVSEESMDADGNNNNSQPSVPSFGSSVAAPSATPFSFPAPSSNTGFNFSGAQQTASFKFGAVGDTSSTPPIFGGTGGLGTSTAPSFGGSTGNPPQQGGSGGFNFGSPAANSSQPTGAFTIGAGSTSKRVIKRGIRRSRK